MSVSKENFIKTIYKLEQNKNMDTKPGTIASVLGISNAATTDMAKKLAKKKLIHYEKYKKLKLTKAGIKMALNILRKHRLWESFLYQTFDLSLHEIHREAELLEHQTSDFLANKISNFLGNPGFDPHGDPIPTKKGEIFFGKENRLLSKAELGKKYIVTRLLSSDKEFLDFCNTNKIDLGTSLKIENQYQTNEMTEIIVNNKRMLLNNNLLNLIYVKEKEA